MQASTTSGTAFVAHGGCTGLGSAAWSAGQEAEIWITQARLVNYAEIWGNWVLAQNFVFAFNVVSTLTDGGMASISEAISHGRKKLSQYYSVMMYKWGGTISAFLAAALLAVGPRFILGASGPDFKRAAIYAVPLLLWGAIQYPSWVGDQVQLGSNKPYLKAALVAGEQFIRIVLAWVLLERYQVVQTRLCCKQDISTSGAITNPSPATPTRSCSPGQ